MTGGLLRKPGVDTTIIAPAGFRILSALEITARRLGVWLTLTCGCDSHPPSDPHSLGEAYDVRTHDLEAAQKRTVLREVMIELAENHGVDAPMPTSGGLATQRFFGWIEAPGTPQEHLHIQRRKGLTYEPDSRV